MCVKVNHNVDLRIAKIWLWLALYCNFSFENNKHGLLPLAFVNLVTAEEVDDEREGEHDVNEEENDNVDVSSIITKSFDAI